MPLNRKALLLDAGPRSVQDARRWVESVCRDLGRTDLAETAAIGVSELVTNALLHAVPPISVRVRGTRAHPRVEVHDASPRPPTPTLPGRTPPEPLTFGRGLALVAMCSAAWGAELDEGGKVVWFEPAGEMTGERTHPVIGVPSVGLPEPPDGPTIGVRLLDVPVALLLASRAQSQELRRELRLLTIARPEEYPLAREVGQLFADYERFAPPVAQHAADAQAAGLDSFDLHLQFPESARPVIERLRNRLDVADEFCRSERLLSLARTPAQAMLQRWYLSEFLRQAAGEPPLPWPQAAAGVAAAGS